MPRHYCIVRIINALACCVAFACSVNTKLAADASGITLRLTRPPTAEEAVGLQLTVGSLSAGARIRVLSSAGVVLGTVSPYGASRQKEANSYTIVLPKSAVKGGRVRLHLEVEEPNKAAHPPGLAEVESVRLIYLPVSRR